MKTFKEITTNPRTYIESVGRYDRQHVVQAVQEQGEGTVLRTCFWLR